MQFSRTSFLALSVFSLTASARIIEEGLLANSKIENQLNDLFDAIPECIYTCLAFESKLATTVMTECFGDRATGITNEKLSCACSKVNLDDVLPKTIECGLTSKNLTDGKECTFNAKQMGIANKASFKLKELCDEQVKAYPVGLSINTTDSALVNGTKLDGPVVLDRLDNGTTVPVDGKNDKNDDKKDGEDEKDSGSAVFTASSILMGLGLFTSVAWDLF